MAQQHMRKPVPTETQTQLFWRGERSVREIRYENITTIPMIIASFVFLLSMSILILDDLNYFQGIDAVLIAVLFIVWIAFWVDFIVRFALSANRRSFLRHNIIDFVSLIVPVARPFLLLVYLSRLPYFSGREGKNVRARVIVYLLSFSVLYTYVISLLVYSAERDAPGASINSYGNSVWWALTTLSTVGYGDVVPVTIVGRIYAGFLMLGGMLLVGATTGLVVSWFGQMITVAHQREKDKVANGSRVEAASAQKTTQVATEARTKNAGKSSSR